MTLDDAREATAEAAQAATQLAAHLARLRNRMSTLLPVSSEALAGWDDDRRERLHALLRMFEQLYDLVGRKLLRGYLVLSGEDAAALSALSVARRVEKLGALHSTEEWIELGATRNRLVHDYPVSLRRQADVSNAAWQDIDRLLAAAALIIQRLRGEHLIP